MPLSRRLEAPAILGVPWYVDRTLSKASPLLFPQSPCVFILLFLSLIQTVRSGWI